MPLAFSPEETNMDGSTTIPVGIAGVRGYKGTEAARLIAGHPSFRLAMVASDVMAGGRLRDIDPDLVRDGDAQAVGYNDTVSAAVDSGVALMFLATRPAACAALARDLLSRGIRVVDLSGAHCIKDPDIHINAYGFLQADPEISEEAQYGLTELVAPETLASARLVANPTSYATAVLLPLLPLAEAGLVEPHSVVVDIKAGSTAAGRKARIALLHAELAQNCYPEKIDRHQHTPEVLEQLARVAGPSFRLTLTSHLLPVPRGQLATCYLRVSEAIAPTVEVAAARVRETLRARYAASPFVQVVDRAEAVSLRAVVGTNRCLIGVASDPYGDRVVVVAALDNMLKGAAGQAMQNANLMMGRPETAGLELATGGRP